MEAAMTVRTESRVICSTLPAACCRPVVCSTAVMIAPGLLLVVPTLFACDTIPSVMFELDAGCESVFVLVGCAAQQKSPAMYAGRMIYPAPHSSAGSACTESVRQRRRANNCAETRSVPFIVASSFSVLLGMCSQLGCNHREGSPATGGGAMSLCGHIGKSVISTGQAFDSIGVRVLVSEWGWMG